VATAATRRVLTRDHLLGEAGGDGPAVGQRREDGGGVPQHAADAQHQQHEEVEHGVQLGHLHVFDGFGIDDERQPGALDGLPARRGEEVSCRWFLGSLQDTRTGTEETDPAPWQSTLVEVVLPGRGGRELRRFNSKCTETILVPLVAKTLTSSPCGPPCPAAGASSPAPGAGDVPARGCGLPGLGGRGGGGEAQAPAQSGRSPCPVRLPSCSF